MTAMPIPRPPGAPMTYRCGPCRIELCDGVEYPTCPRCGRDVDWIDVPPTTTTTLPSVPRIARALFLALLAAQIMLALLDPWAFPYLVPITILIQLYALRALVEIAFAPMAFYELARDRRTRVVHGFEHATAAILGEHGIAVTEGLSVPNGFSIMLPHHQRVFERFRVVEAAARAAIERIAAGETALAYHDRCGTSWLVGNAVVSVATVGLGITAFVLGVPPGITFAATVIAIAAAARGAVPLGRLAQRLWTVSTDFAAARVLSVTRHVTADASHVGFDIAIEVVPRDDRAELVAPDHTST
jgi:hypothetical protein